MINALDNKVINLASIIYYLIPLALLTGPFLPDLFITIISIIFLYISIKEKKFRYYKNNFFYFFIFFYLYLIISSLNSEYYLFSLKSSLPYIRFILFALATWFLINEKNNFIKNFSKIFILTFLFAIADGYFQKLFGHSIFGYSSANIDRLNLAFNHRMILGGYLSRLLPLLVAFLIILFNTKKTKSYLIISLILIISDLLIYLSGERTAIGIATISILFVFLFLKDYRLLRFISLITSISIIIIVTYLSPELKSRNIDHTIEQMGLNGEKIILFSHEHEKLFKNAYYIYLDNKILGSGPNTFRKYCSKNFENINCSTHPHNSYVQLISETGLLGLLFIFIIIIYLSYLMLKHTLSLFNKNYSGLETTQILLITCFFCTLWPFFPSLNFFINWMNIIYYLPIGFFLHTIYK